MSRLPVVLVLMILLVGGPREVPGQMSPDSTVLRAWVSDYEAVFNARDAAALARFFADDADMVIGNLPPTRGRPAIEASWRAYFEAQEPGRRGSFDVTSIRFPALGVGLIDLDSTTGGRDSSGVDHVIRRARGTWVVARRDGEWSILALRALPSVRDSVVLVTSVLDEKAPPEDVEVPPGIRAFVETYEHVFNDRDPEAVTALYADDADIIVRDMPVTRGRPAIEASWRAYFADRPYFSDPDLRIRFAIQRVRVITPDAALIDLVAGADRGKDARGIPTRTARATWVVVRREGGWRIAALRVLPGEHDRILREHELRRESPGDPLSPTEVSGTFAPVGPPLEKPVRVDAGGSCVVDLRQAYTVSGTLSGSLEIDYRILVHGPCEDPPVIGEYDEEWIASGTFTGRFERSAVSGDLIYTAQVRAGGDVEGRMWLGRGLDGELAVSGNFGDGALSYQGRVTISVPVPR